MALNNFDHDPDAVLDYSIDWSDWLASGEVISTSAWTVPTGITQDTATKTDSVATIWISGGTAGQIYTVTNHIVTDGGREDDRSLHLHCKER